MTSIYTRQRGSARYGTEYGLGVVSAHNPADNSRSRLFNSAKQLPDYTQNDLEAACRQEQPFIDDIPTPRSITASDGIRTRSGQRTRRADSPLNVSKSSGISKSPASRSSRDKKPKFDKSRMPKLTAPLSVLTKDMSIPMKDMDAWVNRSIETRQQEVEKRNGYVTRPMNSFMLYRSAYADRTKAWCTQNNHQVVSSVSGESWPMETQEVRKQFSEWARVERDNHQAAHPHYKFSPSKFNTKRRKIEVWEEEAELSSVDGEPDESYRPAGRSVQRRKCTLTNESSVRTDDTVGLHPHPYFNQQDAGFAYSSAPYINASPPVQSHSWAEHAYDTHSLQFNMHTGLPTQQPAQSLFDYQYGQGIESGLCSVPLNTSGPVGEYGLPGGQQMPGEHGSLYAYTQQAIPLMEQYYQHSGYSQQLPYEQQISEQMYEHQRWLQAQCQPQLTIDPGLEADLAAFDGHGGSYGQDDIHYDHLLANGPIPEYFEECCTPNGALASAWKPMEILK